MSHSLTIILIYVTQRILFFLQEHLSFPTIYKLGQAFSRKKVLIVLLWFFSVLQRTGPHSAAHEDTLRIVPSFSHGQIKQKNNLCQTTQVLSLYIEITKSI